METPKNNATNGAPVSGKLDADVASTLVSSILQALRLGGATGQPLSCVFKLTCLHACKSTGIDHLHVMSAPWQLYNKQVSSRLNVLLLHAGVEAQLMVPRALTVLESSIAAQQAWMGAWGSIPLHVLLPWAAQMLSLLDSSEGLALLPALRVSTPSEVSDCCNRLSIKSTLYLVLPSRSYEYIEESFRSRGGSSASVPVHRRWHGSTSSGCTFLSNSAASTTAGQATRGLPSLGRCCRALSWTPGRPPSTT